MATANVSVKQVLDHLNQRIGSGGGVVDSWSDGNGNWWRKYADGWIEQGGVASDGEISFHVPFSKTDYFITLMMLQDSPLSSPRAYIGERNTGNASIKLPSWGGYSNNIWYACGY